MHWMDDGKRQRHQYCRWSSYPSIHPNQMMQLGHDENGEWWQLCVITISVMAKNSVKNSRSKLSL